MTMSRRSPSASSRRIELITSRGPAKRSWMVRKRCCHSATVGFSVTSIPPSTGIAATSKFCRSAAVEPLNMSPSLVNIAAIGVIESCCLSLSESPGMLISRPLITIVAERGASISRRMRSGRLKTKRPVETSGSSSSDRCLVGVKRALIDCVSFCAASIARRQESVESQMVDAMAPWARTRTPTHHETTDRLGRGTCSRRQDEVGQRFDGGERRLADLLIGNGDVKPFLDQHHQLERIDRVEPEALDEDRGGIIDVFRPLVLQLETLDQ